MEGKYGYYYCKNGSLSSMMNSDDFEEQDVWDVNDTKGNHDESQPSKNPNAWLLASSPKTNLPTTQNVNTNDPKLTQSKAGKVIHQKSSAPIRIPTNNWSKINPNKGFCSWIKDGNDDVNAKRDQWDDDDDDDDDDDELDSMLPPHEFIAKRLARNHISTFSVFEGKGRTLKGRDLSRIRDAILIKTGFYEPPS